MYNIYYSDMDNDPMLNGAYGYNANPMVRQTSVSLADMLRVLADHVGDFNRLLLNPRSVVKYKSSNIFYLFY